MKTKMKSLRFPLEILDKSKAVMKKKQITFTQLTMTAIASYIKDEEYFLDMQSFTNVLKYVYLGNNAARVNIAKDQVEFYHKDEQ